jgi:hypothetical protein
VLTRGLVFIIPLYFELRPSPRLFFKIDFLLISKRVPIDVRAEAIAQRSSNFSLSFFAKRALPTFPLPRLRRSNEVAPPKKYRYIYI